ncbi:hypothetical protein [Microbacterium candidum]|uniref:Uncharacterized protein n=1 Tax=Microbacterium candidum TaxID=3041922 RepID=A0ABT7MVX7_9MICO|nr:hypothetical protein [Microbacterium sp. ASV49]MDL9978587.1 hypothetical protein [Microbacterium sp. ASV49]
MKTTLTTVDRANVETVLYRVAICAFTYYEGKEIDDPGFSVRDDVEWCLAALGTHAETAGSLRADIHAMITDRDADRRTFIARLAALAEE